MGITENRLLMGSMIALALYWIGGSMTPAPYLSGLVSLLLLIAGIVTLASYTPDTYRILIQEYRSQDEFGRGSGSHLAIYGVWLLAAGSFYSGVYGLAWITWGQPLSWIGTPFSNFGRVLFCFGFALMSASPNVTNEGMTIPDRLWIYIVLAAAAAAIFWAGTQFGNDDAVATPMHADSPVCPADRPVWGSRSLIYHIPSSLTERSWCRSGASIPQKRQNWQDTGRQNFLEPENQAAKRPIDIWGE